MKVAHVTLYPPKGEKHVRSSGVASYTKNLITQLGNEGSEHVVICDKNGSQKAYMENNTKIYRAFVRTPRFIFQVHNILRKENPDIIHIQQELALYGGVFTAYLLQWLVLVWRKKAVITLHGVVDPAKINTAFVRENNARLPVWLVRLAFRIIYTPLMKLPQAVIVHEQQFKQTIEKSYGVQPEKIKVIPHGVETFTTILPADARRQLGLRADAKIVLFMGYATGYKGLGLLIEGFARFARTHKDAFLVIGAGKHPKLHDDQAYLREYAHLQKKAARTIPAVQYVWQGFIGEEQITTYYSAADVSLYPYTTVMSSSGPMSFAIGHEKPFLVSTAFEEVFASCPQLLFSRNAKSLASKLEYFFSRQEQFTTVSRKLKAERTWQHVAYETFQIYKNIHNEKGAYEAEKSTATW